MKNTRADWRALAGWAILLWLICLTIGYYIYHKPIMPELALSLARLVWQVGISLAILSVAGGIGRRLLRKLSVHPLADMALQAGLGFGMLSLAMLAAGYLGLYKPLFTGLGLLGLGLILWRDTLDWWREWEALKSLWKSGGWFGWATGGFVLLILGFTLITALAPPLKFDALVYHLALPRLYLLNGRLAYQPQIMFWGMPQMAEMIYTWAMSLGGEPAAAVTGWLVGVVTLAGLLGFIASRLEMSAGWASVAALMAGLSLSTGLAWGYADWWVLLFSLGFLICLSEWIESHNGGLLLLAGLLAGMALSTKYTAGLLLIFGGVVILWNWKPLGGFKGVFLALTRVGLPAVLVFFPWLLKNWLATGNPFYPLIFPAGAMSSLRLALYQGGGTWGNWTDFVFLPLRATIMGVEGGAGYNTSIGPLLVGLGLASVLSWQEADRRQRMFIGLCALITITGILIWMVTGRFSSYLLMSRLNMPLFPALAVLAGAGFCAFTRFNMFGVRFSRVVGCLVLLVLGLNTFETGMQTVRQGVLRTALGVSTPDWYLGENLGWFGPAMQAVDQLPEGARVLMLWEARSFYCLPKCEPDEIIDRWQRERHEGRGSACCHGG